MRCIAGFCSGGVRRGREGNEDEEKVEERERGGHCFEIFRVASCRGVREQAESGVVTMADGFNYKGMELEYGLHVGT